MQDVKGKEITIKPTSTQAHSQDFAKGGGAFSEV